MEQQTISIAKANIVLLYKQDVELSLLEILLVVIMIFQKILLIILI